MKDFNIAKYLKEHNLGPHAILGKYVDLHSLKEEEVGNNKPVDEVPYKGAETKLDGFGDEFDQDEPISEAEGSFDVSLSYADYPSISDAQQRLAIIHFKKLVKSLGGNAVKTGDEFDEINFNITGIDSFEELKNVYDKVVEDDDDDYTTLPSWELEPGKNEDDSDIEKNPWMQEVDGSGSYKINGWTCDYEHPGILVWQHEDKSPDELVVYATPNWDLEGRTPIQIDQNAEFVESMSLPKGNFADFNEYANDMKPMLDSIANKYIKMAEEVSVSSSGVEMEEEMSDEQDRFGAMMDLSHEYLQKVSPIVKYSIDKLRAKGFSDQDIIDFLSTDWNQ